MNNTIAQTATAAATGLSETAAAAQLKISGYNELPSSKPKSVLRIVLDVIREPMLILLLSCGTLYMLLGDFGEGFMLLASILLVMVISFFQEKKSERALDELRDLSSPRALVIRDGKEKRIPGREVVPGDIVVLQEGDRVPADAVVLSAVNLQTDESLLSGESEAVAKKSRDHAEEQAADNRHHVYSGTLIVRGHGTARVEATGQDTSLGKIGKLLQNVKDEPTLLQQETRRIVRVFSILGLGVCLLLIIIYGLTRGHWLEGVLYGLSLAMAMLPEEFAVVLTLFMLLGSWRMSRKNVLTRRPAAIETLGSVTVLCTDKTGTLTENRMDIRKLVVNGKTYTIQPSSALPGETAGLIRTAALAGQPQPFDPMEKAIAGLQQKLTDPPREHAQPDLIKEYPLSPQLFAMTRVYASPEKGKLIVATKGAPEAIATLCRFSEEEKKILEQQVAALAADGLRVLGVATGTCNADALPVQQQELNYKFSGLIGMEDPLRTTISDDLASCYAAGIRVIMITGDYPATAQHVARKMGLRNADAVITGSAFAAMDELEQKARIKTVNVFARMVPEQKLLLVELLKEQGEVVAMTGDGVNDAPALQSANIGIAMGQRGTDVAREAADLVLLDDNFSSIIAAVRTGRRIYDNIRKAMAYIFAVHVPVAGLTLVPVFFPFLPTVLFPLHIAFLELIIDPASSLIFEAEQEEKDIMSRPPADVHQPVFGAGKIVLGLLQGVAVLVLSLGVLLLSMNASRSVDEVRTMTFVTLVVANIGLIFINRSRTRSFFELQREKNKSVKWVTGGAFAFLALMLFVPAVRSLFHFTSIHTGDLLLSIAAGAAGMFLFELIKWWRKKRQEQRLR